MPQIFTPTNQKLLTNVVVVKLKKGGKRFEIACYKNKVVAWRNKIEKNLEEVLQTDTVFTNVSRGDIAKASDLKSIFKTDDKQKICIEILEKGEFQLSEKERQSQLNAKFTETATNITNMCINPSTQRPYPVSLIEQAMKDAHISVKPNKSAKQQALEVIKTLKDSIPIERVKMKIRISMNSADSKKCKDSIRKLFASIESEDHAGGFEIIGISEPGNYRELTEIVGKHSRGKGLCEVICVDEVDKAQDVFNNTST